MNLTNPLHSSTEDESQVSSLTDSLAETRLFSSQPKTTGDTQQTTVEAQPIPPESGEENLWATPTEQQKREDLLEAAKCPVHLKLCNPNVCSEIEPHCRSLGINYRDLKAKSGGPSNIYTLDRGQRFSHLYFSIFAYKYHLTQYCSVLKERQAAEEEKPVRNLKNRGTRNKRHNPAATLW